jgi:hypothetical protein
MDNSLPQQQPPQQPLHYMPINASSSPTCLIERAAELNEDGVYELADGSFSEAVQSFESALRHMMQLSMALNSGNNSSSDHNAALKAVPSSGGDQEMLPPSRTSVEIPYLQDDLFYLYSCTVTFNPSSGIQPTATEISFYGATVMFNLALAHHQNAQRCRKGSLQQAETSLRQALALYQECTNTLQSLSVVRNDDMLLMQLATLNNQAHILYTLGLSTDPSTQCVFHTLMTQSMSALQERPNNNFSPFEQSQINEFVRNSLVFGLQPAIGAACA